MNKKLKISIITIVFIIIISSICIGIYLAKEDNNETYQIANGIILKKSNNSYESKIIKTYIEYTELLQKYEVNDIVLFTNNSFEDKDYIVDFIDYEDQLKINDIDVLIEDDGINLIYHVNKKVNSDQNYLMYFIPIDKDTLNDVNIKSRSFTEK